jgi:hypothetical protein
VGCVLPCGTRPRCASLPPSRCLFLCYRTDCVIISRALISSLQGGYMLNAARVSGRRAPAPPSPNQSLAKHNRKPLQLAENKHRRPKSIASFCRFLAPAPHLADHYSRIAPFLFNTNVPAQKNLTCSQQTRKQFLFNTFGRFRGLLSDTFERPSTYPPRFAMYPFLSPARHGRIAAL